MKYRLIFLQVLKVFDEPSGESNTERQIKISDGISKEFTCLEGVQMQGGKILRPMKMLVFAMIMCMIKIFRGEGVVDGEEGSSERCLKWVVGAGGSLRDLSKNFLKQGVGKGKSCS